MGKIGLVKMMSAWWPKSIMGTILGLLAVSNCLSESISRTLLSQLLKVLTWEHVFYISTSTALVMIFPTVLFVRNKKDQYLHNPTADEEVDLSKNIPTTPSLAFVNKKSNYNDLKLEKTSEKASSFNQIAGINTKKRSFREAVKESMKSVIRLLSNRQVLLLCFSSIVTTTICEIHGQFGLIFLQDYLKIPDADCGTMTALFSVSSATGALVSGKIMDAFHRRTRGILPYISSII